ncbi:MULTISPECIES: hypothetical protein [Streptomyces]|uniref:hypothetical protein n=1 Tax=Streptomyces TaxID=1883 RepID=UPI0022490260|nr:hypothetical protein [Streptomyces sp. JHD 1]MCX2970363.1 hypothetical protein [Streptomyces sp. JHD 1]
MSDAAQPTAAEVRASVEALKSALDHHLEVVERRARGTRGAAADAAVNAAYDDLAAAGEAYDALLYGAYDEVTPFEIPGGESAHGYLGPDEPTALSVYMRRDYTVSDPLRLLAQAQRVTDLDPDAVDPSEGDADTPGSSVHAALGVLFGEFEPDELATRHKEFGLTEGDSTLWVVADDEPAEPGEWLDQPFDGADPERVVCRYDISTVFDDEDTEDIEDTEDTEDIDADDADDADADAAPGAGQGAARRGAGGYGAGGGESEDDAAVSAR